MSAPDSPDIDDVWNILHALIEGRAQSAEAIRTMRNLDGEPRDSMIENLADLRAAAIVVTHRCLDAGEQELVKLRMIDRLARWGMRDAIAPDDRPEPAA
jgi:hypothetical protein